jgi:dephospho-CoA kinase
VTEEHAKQMIESQMPLELKVKMCDIPIQNDGNEKQLVKQL